MHAITDLAMVEWFPAPTYPDDGDPLLVKIDLNDPPPANCTDPFIHIESIDPTSVMYELVSRENLMFMMRIRGIDIVPVPDC